MEFVNEFRNFKKNSSNVYQDFILAWAEYEYTVSQIKTQVTDIINEDFKELRQKYDLDDDEIHLDFVFNNNEIVIKFRPFISIDALEKISEYMGVLGYISIIKSKNPRIQIKFVTQDDNEKLIE